MMSRTGTTAGMTLLDHPTQPSDGDEVLHAYDLRHGLGDASSLRSISRGLHGAGQSDFARLNGDGDLVAREIRIILKRLSHPLRSDRVVELAVGRKIAGASGQNDREAEPEDRKFAHFQAPNGSSVQRTCR